MNDRIQLFPPIFSYVDTQRANYYEPETIYKIQHNHYPQMKLLIQLVPHSNKSQTHQFKIARQLIIMQVVLLLIIQTPQLATTLQINKAHPIVASPPQQQPQLFPITVLNRFLLTIQIQMEILQQIKLSINNQILLTQLNIRTRIHHW